MNYILHGQTTKRVGVIKGERFSACHGCILGLLQPPREVFIDARLSAQRYLQACIRKRWCVSAVV